MDKAQVCREDFYRVLNNPDWSTTTKLAEIIGEAGSAGANIFGTMLKKSLESLVRGGGAHMKQVKFKSVRHRRMVVCGLSALRMTETVANQFPELSFSQGHRLGGTVFFLPQQLLVMAHSISDEEGRKKALGILSKAGSVFSRGFLALKGIDESHNEVLSREASSAASAAKRAQEMLAEIPETSGARMGLERRPRHEWALKFSRV